MAMEWNYHPQLYNNFIVRMFCLRAGLSLQTQAPRLQFCPKAGFLPQTKEPRMQFYLGSICAGSSVAVQI